MCSSEISEFGSSDNRLQQSFRPKPLPVFDLKGYRRKLWAIYIGCSLGVAASIGTGIYMIVATTKEDIK